MAIQSENIGPNNFAGQARALSGNLARDGKVQRLVLFSEDAIALKELLKNDAVKKKGGVTSTDIDGATKVVASSDLGEGIDCDIDERTGDLKISREYFAAMVRAKFGNDLEAEVLPEYTDNITSVVSTSFYDELSEKEQEAHNVLINTSNILKRVFNRRNGMLSWLFLAGLKSQGIITGEDKPETFVEEVESVFVGDKDFIKRYAECSEAGLDHSSIDRVFADNDKHRKLAKIAGFINTVAKNVSSNFINWFPRAFAIQNMLLPFVLKPIKNTGIGKLLSWVRIANPFIDEFVNTYIALCGDEFQNIKRSTEGHGDKNPEVVYANGELNNDLQEFSVGEIVLSEGGMPLDNSSEEQSSESPAESAENVAESGETTEPVEADAVPSEEEQAGSGEDAPVVEVVKSQAERDREAYDLQNIIFTASSAVKRLTRPRNLSGIIFQVILDRVGFKDYEEFEAKVVKNPSFMKGLYNHLSSLDENSPLSEVSNVEDSFENPHERATAKAALAIMTMTRSASDGFMKVFPKVFGLPYSVFYLGVPIVNKMVGEDSLFGKLIDFAQMIVPAINDIVVDPMSSAFEEANVVRDLVNKKENENLFSGMPRVSMAKSGSWVLDSFKNLGKSIKRMRWTSSKPIAE